MTKLPYGKCIKCGRKLYADDDMIQTEVSVTYKHRKGKRNWVHTPLALSWQEFCMKCLKKAIK